MRKLVLIFSLSIVIAVVLFVAAFFYIDFSVHESATYDALVGGKLFGTVEVDRFVTEDKVIYKSRTDMPYLLSYRFSSEKLFLKKNGRMPLRFIREENNGRGISRFTLLVQNYDRTDYLFLEPPKFLALQAFETGEKTLLFSPRDIMTYMALMEKYNYWKKGTQYFEIMVPVADAIPLMRDKIEVKEVGDEFVPVMGRKVEGEAFRIKARGLPEARITLAKYTHHLLTLQVGKDNMTFVMTSYAEDPGKRLKALVRHAAKSAKENAGLRDGAASSEKKQQQQLLSGDMPDAPETILRKVFSPSVGSQKYREVFFESGGLILSGKVWAPAGDGVFPSVLILPKNGPTTSGWQMLSSFYGEALSRAGYVVMTFDSPGQGKSQGDLLDLDDAKQRKNIKAAVDFLRRDPLVSKAPVMLVGYRGSGYNALESARELTEVGGCIILCLSGEQDKNAEPGRKALRDKVQRALAADGIGPFDAGYMDTITVKLEKQLSAIMLSSDEFAYFSGTKLPEGAYRRMLERKLYRSILAAEKPLLLVTGKNDPDFVPAALDAIKKSTAERDSPVKIAVFNNLDLYMGKMTLSDSSWSFSGDEDVLKSIVEWLSRNRGAVADEKPVPVLIQTAPESGKVKPESSPKISG